MDQKNPVLLEGSRKWYGRIRWGFYVNMFFSIADRESYSLKMSPVEYLESWERIPRTMAIMLVIQDRARYRAAEMIPKVTGKNPRKAAEIKRRAVRHR
jgi:hypothetical protein